MIIALYNLHYGKEWFKWSLRALRDRVDEIYGFYVAKPSYGHSTDLPCPDSEEELRAATEGFNVHWVDFSPYHFRNEGHHRETSIEYLKRQYGDKMKVLIPLDADEVFEPRLLDHCLEFIQDRPEVYWRVPMQHFWRSVKWVCRDASMPMRLMKMNGTDTRQEGYIHYGHGYIHHFGYAQRPDVIRYKMTVHGHKNEWRQGWYNDRFISWRPVLGDVHPTNVDFWTPAAFNPEEISHLIGDHPYFFQDLIE
jgi:hypothetical protein